MNRIWLLLAEYNSFLGDLLDLSGIWHFLRLEIVCLNLLLGFVRLRDPQVAASSALLKVVLRATCVITAILRLDHELLLDANQLFLEVPDRVLLIK